MGPDRAFGLGGIRVVRAAAERVIDVSGATRVGGPAVVIAVIAVLIAGCSAEAGASRPAGSPVAVTSQAATPTGAGAAGTKPAGTARAPATATAGPARAPATAGRTGPATRARRLARPRPSRRPPFGVGLRLVTFVDRSRHVRFPGGRPQARRLVTLVRYPATGPASQTDAARATPARSSGPFPLVVFGHGFAVTPRIYAAMLEAWVRAGYVVAAPIFPLENADAPGGPNESDLVNQPRDMSVVISGMLAANMVPGGVFAGLIDPRSIGVAGQSDGGETALAVAYDRYYRDRRVGAAVILSGAEIPGVGGFDFPAHSPPLLATQGTADVINLPSLTRQFFDLAPSPKYLLTMFGADHLGPYTDVQPQLGIVERVTVAFLDEYLKNSLGAGRRLRKAGDVPQVARLRAG